MGVLQRILSGGSPYVAGWVSGARAEAGKGYLPGPVHSNMPIDQIVDMLGGDMSSRSMALRVGALHRCVTLISSTVAELIANTAHVVDFDRTRMSRQPVDLLHMIRSSPDGYNSGYGFLEDLMMDLLLDGNALMVVDRMTRKPLRLKRMIPSTAQIVKKSGRLLYHGEVTGPMENPRMDYFDSQDVVHARWADATGRDMAPTRSGRAGFAASPLVALGDDLHVSREIVRWIAKFYDQQGGALKSDHAVIYPDPVPPDQQKDVIAGLAEYAAYRKTMVLFGGAKLENLKTLPQDAETSTLRDQETENIGRVYGIPPPLMGLHTTQWGSGISELARLYWKFSGRPIMNRLLQPMSLRLLPKGQEFAVNEVEMLRGDMAALTALITATKAGPSGEPAVLSRKEHRMIIGFDSDFPEDEEAPPAPAPNPPDKDFLPGGLPGDDPGARQ